MTRRIARREPTSDVEHLPGGTASSEARRVADRLVGLPVPSVVLGGGVDLRELVAESASVFYLFPGSSSSPGDGEDTPLMDAAQHWAFRNQRADLEDRSYRVIGVSSQSEDAQLLAEVTHRTEHMLLSDPELRLARELTLPTFEVDGTSCYQRLTLVIARGGCIEKAFFPVACAGRSAAQVVAWMTIQGI